MKFILLIGALVIFEKISKINCHGRLINPPARSSAWRENPRKFPIFYGDNQMFCGGFDTQMRLNKGRCGICGEDFGIARNFELGGKLYRGHIVRSYLQGQRINVDVEITANHKGYFEFRICNRDWSGEATQDCLNQNVLKDKFGRIRIPVMPGLVGIIRNEILLPTNLICNRCVFQWKYHTANSYGVDQRTRKGCIGCGPQEEFYGCADVKILPSTMPRSALNMLLSDSSMPLYS